MPQHSDDDLQLFHTLYAIAISVGFLDLARAVFDAWTRVKEQSLTLEWALVVTLLPAGLLLLALRMTWGVASLSRFIADRRECKQPVCPQRITLWHYPALLAHAFAVFVLCHIAALVADPDRLGRFLPPFFGVLAGLLFFNALYLFTVLPRKDVDEDKVRCDTGRKVKIDWIANNIAFGIFIVVVLLGPSSPTDPWGVGLLIGAMFLNSLLDLGFAARYYVPRF
jgi:hypothetical protein